MSKRMTDGERLIWAAVFAKHYKLNDPPKHVVTPGNDEAWHKWEAGIVSNAIERAAYAVEHVRESDVEDGWEPGSAVLECWRDMVGRQ